MDDYIDDLFAENCFLPCIGEVEKPVVHVRKDLETLEKELDVIKSNIEEIKARKWHIEELIKFHNMGLEAR